MIRRILSTSVRIAIVGSALATPLMVGEANAQTALTVPPGLPEWAFNIPDKVQPSAVKPEGIVRAPGSAKEYEWAKVAGNANPPDWFPDEHPPAPRAVTGGAGIRFACGSCHLMSGQSHRGGGRHRRHARRIPDPADGYYKAGTRKDDARMGPIAKSKSDEDIRQAAEYFAALKPRVWVKVIETGNAAEDVHRDRRPPSPAPSRRRHRADRTPHPRNSRRSVPHGNP